jgi:diadenosine tetraphosphate (Ap4A) HIT family hydrolase
MRHHETYEKFGGDGALITSYDHWSVLARPKQPTLGATVLIAHADVRAFGALPAPAFAELGRVIADLEQALEAAFEPDKVNYLTLMMVDPHVHTHALPRYAAPREFEGGERHDAVWPGPPDLKADVGDVAEAVRETMKAAWVRS